jgi:hypothetical protein
MKKQRSALHRTRLQPVSVVAARSIKRFSAERRNVVRGLVAASRRGKLAQDTINSIRNNGIEADMAAAAAILESPGGLRGRKVIHLLQDDVKLGHSLKRHPPALEAAYACGFLNEWKAESLKAIDTIALLSRLTEVPTADALGALLQAVRTWGASNYIAMKIVYLKEFWTLDDADEAIVTEIEQAVGHDHSPMIQ